MSELRGQARVAAYHAQHQNDLDWRRIGKIARRFQPNPRLERILAHTPS